MSVFSFRSPLGKAVRLPLRAIPPRMPMVVLSGPLRGQRWLAGGHVHGCWLGRYEAPKLRLFSELLAPGDVVFDLGANAGYYSLLAAARVGPRGRVLSVEPLPRNLSYLEANVGLNKHENIDIIKAAIGAEKGVMRFDDSRKSAMGRLDESGTLEVSVETIDDLVESGRASPPTLIKMDIEGAEAGALRGGRRTLVEHKPIVLLATHGDAVREACLAFLDEVGYQTEGVAGEPADNPCEFLATPVR